MRWEYRSDEDMLEVDKSPGDVTRPIESAADLCSPLYGSDISASPFSPDGDITIYTMSSDLKKLKEEVTDIISLKSELCSYREKISKNIDLLLKTVNDLQIVKNQMCINPASPASNNIIDIVRSDMEKLKEEADDIAILKHELWSYQIKSAQKINTLQKFTKSPR